MKSVAEASYWDAHWINTNFEIASHNHPLRGWIENNFSKGNNKSCLEIGCYPGKLLAVFGEKGYTLSGIDSFNGTATSLPQWLESNGYKIGNFYESDFLTTNVPDTYDIVCSFGLVEHFENYRELIKRHTEITKTGGRVVVEVPNLASPLYHNLYRTFEPNHTVGYLLKDLPMNLERISETLKENGCTIERADYVGHFYFRFVTHHSIFHKTLSFLINCFRPILQLLPRSKYSRYIAVIAIKN